MGHNKKLALTVRRVLLGMVAAHAGNLLALDLKLSAGGGVEHTNNSTKVSNNEQSDLERRANLDVDLLHEGKSVDAKAAYSVDFIDYDKNTQDSSTEINGDLSLEYRQIENLLRWTLTNSIRNVKRDTAAVDIANNRDNRSITTLAPELTLRISPVDMMALVVSYSDISYEDSDNDSNRAGAQANYEHSISKVDAAGLSLNYDQVAFDTSGGDYDYYRAVAFYRAQLVRLNYTVSAGYNETKYDNSNLEFDGAYFSAEADYAYGYSSFGLLVVQELTDTSQGNNNGDITDQTPSQNTDTIDVYTRRSIQANYGNRALCPTCSVDLYLSIEDDQYEGPSDDNVESTAGMRFGYGLTRLSSIGLDASYTNVAYDGNNTPADYSVARYRISWHSEIARDLDLNTYIGYEQRSSNDAYQEYDELRGGVAISYQFL